MSWLSTSLSENLTNITGQISTFTKDMLTEGTVEVDGRKYLAFLLVFLFVMPLVSCILQIMNVVRGNRYLFNSIMQMLFNFLNGLYELCIQYKSN